MSTISLRKPGHLAFALAATLFATSALAQAKVPSTPLDGLTQRAPGWQAVPVRRPSVIESFASGCTPADPELAWARLPVDLRELSLEAMIGQLLVISFTGKAPGDAGVAIARDALAASKIGGVLFFRHNIGTAAEVKGINAIFAKANPRLPAMIAIDQEGGAVTRVRPSEGAPATASARDVAATTPAEALKVYGEMAGVLADLGFTANFGPVVDLEVNASNPVIAKFGRSYGADPATVVQYAEAFVEAHHAAGVATALKHFPGHGSSTDDSHVGTIDLGPTWHRAEMIPFRDMIADHTADMVMIGHLKLDGLTGPDGLPASLSPVAIDTFLRDTLCFEGLVVSDDLAMDAIADTWGSAEAARLMVEAGGDVALLSLPQGKGMALVDEITTRLAAEARASTAFADRIRHAYARVVHHKLDLAEARRLSRTARPASNVRLAVR